MISALQRIVGAVAITISLSVAGQAQNSPPSESDTAPVEPQAAVQPPAEAPSDEYEPVDPIELLFKQIEIMRDEMNDMRVQLAQAQLEASSAQRERDELKQFIADHDQYRSDFAQYQTVKAIAERDAKRKEVEEARQQREAEKSQREARVQHYRNAGFTPIGLDVFTGKMAFFYPAKDVSGTQVEYEYGIGPYLTPIGPFSEIDYGKMTISGSVINASDELRNIGVAITFFDDNGNQVGHEIVQIKNARPDVPYPFTSKIDMALNRAFTSSSTYVLYADPAETE